MDAQYAIEKFTRCPKCRSFSLKGVRPNGENGGSETTMCTVYACSNCGDKYVLHGNTLKKKNNLLFSKTPDTEKQERLPEERAKQEPVIPKPVEMKKKSLNRTAVSLISIFIIAVLGFIFFLYPGITKEEHEAVPQPPRVEEEKQVDVAVEKEQVTTANTENQENEGSGEDMETTENTEAVDETESTPALEDTSQNDMSENDISDETTTEESPTVSDTLQQENERVFYKIFDSSLVKVRKSSPDFSDKSHRWFFNRKTITINRSKDQRVYIAGDATGKSKWAVDDEISINGQRIKGCSEELSVIGYIPKSKQVQPMDITHLVPAEKDTALDIRLIDYGIFWGNTQVYVVII